MYSKALILALAATPFVAAHGKIAVVTGDAGGNGTGIGILGGVVPGAGSNSKTEVDTTVFGGKVNIKTNGLGETEAGGKNTVADVAKTLDLSGSTLPQVSADGSGSISGTYHIVTTDGAGPIQAVLDPTGTGSFSNGTLLDTVTQVPGNNGNIAAPKNSNNGRRSLWDRALGKRAANVNEDFPMKFSVPAGTTCSGTVAGQSNVCLVKIANSNPAGPFGGVIAIQMAGTAGDAAASTPTATAAAAAAATTTPAAKKEGKEKQHARDFRA